MIKKSFEFDNRYSDIEQSLEERKNKIKTIRQVRDLQRVPEPKISKILLPKKGDFIMPEKIEIKEIQDIKERLESGSKGKYLPSRRKEEIKSLIGYLSTWLEWQSCRKREDSRRAIKNKAKEENNQKIAVIEKGK